MEKVKTVRARIPENRTPTHASGNLSGLRRDASIWPARIRVKLAWKEPLRSSK